MNDLIATLRAGGAMIWPLLVLAVLAAVIALEKAFVLRARARLPRVLLDLIETRAFSWDELGRRLAALDQRNYFRVFFETITASRMRPAWWLDSRAADQAALIEASLGRWLWLLETIVTAAPLLGLLGTITGMIRAFRLFGAQGLVDPAGVTGGVAEALIATALGLFVALVALFAFNFFSQRQARIMDEMERLGTALIDRVRLDRVRVEGGEGAGRDGDEAA